MHFSDDNHHHHCTYSCPLAATNVAVCSPLRASSFCLLRNPYVDDLPNTMKNNDPRVLAADKNHIPLAPMPASIWTGRRMAAFSLQAHPRGTYLRLSLMITKQRYGADNPWATRARRAVSLTLTGRALVDIALFSTWETSPSWCPRHRANTRPGGGAQAWRPAHRRSCLQAPLAPSPKSSNLQVEKMGSQSSSSPLRRDGLSRSQNRYIKPGLGARGTRLRTSYVAQRKPRVGGIVLTGITPRAPQLNWIVECAHIDGPEDWFQKEDVDGQRQRAKQHHQAALQVRQVVPQPVVQCHPGRSDFVHAARDLECFE